MTEQNPYKVDILFALVSAQTIPNIVHAFDDSIKPKKMVLIYTPEMYPKAQHIEKTIRDKVQVCLEGIDEESASSYNTALEEIYKLYEKYKAKCGQDKDYQTIGLNATGGTKLLSFGAIYVFQEFESEDAIFYIDIGTGDLQMLHRYGQNKKYKQNRKIDANISIKSFLSAYGKECVSSCNKIDQNYKNIREHLIKSPDLVKGINKICYEFKDQNGKFCPQKRPDTKKLSKKALKYLQDNQFITSHNGTYTFSDDEKEFDFISGGWLEEYVFEKLNASRKEIGITDILLNVKIKNPDSKKEQDNEIDIMFIKNNQLHMIECKTANMQRDMKSDDTIYKALAIQHDLKALQCRSAIASQQSLDKKGSNLKPSATRAHQMRIKLFIDNDIKDIVSHVKSW